MASKRLPLPFIRLAVLVAGTSLAIALPGCGGDDTSGEATSGSAATPGMGAGEVPMGKGSRQVTIPGEGDEAVVAEVVSGEMPKDFPKDIPPPPQSEPRNSMFIPGQGGMATFLSKSSRTDVRDYYTKELPGQGWEVGTPSEEEMRTVIEAKKGDRQARVIVANGAEGSEIMITIQGG